MNLYRTKKAQQLIAASYDRLLDEWGVATRLKDIETRYGSTRVIVCGNPEAPPLLLLHGVGDDSALMWIYNAAALAPHFRLFAVDTRSGPVPLIVEHFLHLLKGYNNMAMKYHDIASFSEAQISSIRDKVLYLAGNADPFMIRGGKTALEAERMNVRFFDGVGHGINHEIAEAINAIFIEHFTGSKVRV